MIGLLVSPPAQSTSRECWDTIKQLLEFLEFYAFEEKELISIINQGKGDLKKMCRLNYCREQIASMGIALLEERAVFLKIVEVN